MTRLANKVAVITGGANGIGLETALQFGKEGAKIVLADINQSALDVAVQRVLLYIRETGQLDRHVDVTSPVVGVKTDVSNEAEVKSLIEDALRLYGRLDIMFNNAGIMHPSDDNALTTEEKIWDLTMNINLKGVWFGCKYAIAAMQENPGGPGGSIINTASFVAIMGAATPQLAYTASKGGVLAMTRELAMVHAREGIRLNSLCPGPLKTELLMNFLDTAEKKDRRMVHLPMGRFGEAVEQAKAVTFLASDDSSYITGSDFRVDGGLSSCYVTPTGEPLVAAPSNVAPTLP